MQDDMFTCSIIKCHNVLSSTRESHCEVHRNRLKQYGTLTTTCRRCNEDFQWMGKAVNGSGYCETCYTKPKLIGYEEKKQRISLSRHNLTPENWNEIAGQQNNACKLCHHQPNNGRQGLQVDHDHKCCHNANLQRGGSSCGKCIRGLLCYACNLMIAGYENNKGDLYIPELEKYCRTEFFVFSTPLFEHSNNTGLYEGEIRYDR